LAKTDILNQLDNPEKNGIVTEEELLQRGVIYDSRRRLGENLRRIFETHKQAAETGIHNVFTNEGTIPRGTSLIEESRVHKAKGLNILGKNIYSREDVVTLLSLFRDPRIEISNIILTSENGEVLAHRAYTNGVPGAVELFPKEIFDYLTKEVKIFNPQKAWMSHNHPCGNSKPSIDDICNAKKAYELFNKLNIKLEGDLVLGDESYSVIDSKGQFFQKELPFELKICNHELLKQESLDQKLLCSMFKDILNQKEDVNIIAVLNGDNKLVSWNYIDNEKEVEPVYNYLRASGGICVSILSNNENNYRYYEKLARSNSNTERDIFVDIIKFNNTTSSFEHSFPNRNYCWNDYIILNNPTMHLINRDILQQERLIEVARKIGHVQGVCECVAALGDNYILGKKLLSEMQVTKDMAKKFANPETYKILEEGIFSQKPEQKIERTQGLKR